MSRHLIVVLCLVCFSSFARAGLDPELDQPYRLRVVLSIGESREFTLLFKDRVKRELQDVLQAALGNVGQVEIVDRASIEKELHGKELPRDDRRISLERTLNLTDAVTQHGLKDALDIWKEVSETKTHFVVIQSVDNQYEIQTRQFDGMTGLASPLVRQARIGDRELVVRTAALLIDQDFGIVGTVPANARGSEVQVLLKGGRLGPLTPWVTKGHVFAVAQIKHGSGGQRAFRVGETLLQVLEDPKDGVCRCRLLHRFADPLAAGPAIVGYRCLKLGTTVGTLRIHLVDDKDRSVGVQRLKVAADTTSPKAEDLSTGPDGFTPWARGPYRHVAFVQILTSADEQLSGEIPVEILGDRVVVCRMPRNVRADKSVQLDFDRKHLLLRLNDSLLAASGLVSELNQLSKNPDARDEALRRAKAGLADLNTDLTTYNEEHARLTKNNAIGLEPIRERLEVLKVKKKEFEDYKDELDKIIRDVKDPLRAELRAKANQAQLLERDAQYQQAIDLYEEVVTKGAGQPLIEPYVKHLDQLKKDWEPKSEQHRQARAFVYETWPKLESAVKLKARLPEAQAALKAFEESGDRLSPRMLLKANTAHFTRLTKRLDDILASSSAEDKEEGRLISQINPDLVKLTEDTVKFIKQAPK
jgi:hypothetical protein